MTPIESITEWLLERIRKVNILNPKSNSAFRTLKGVDKYEERLSGFVFYSVQLLLQRFSSDKGDTAVGQAKLTEVSAAIGKMLMDRIGIEATTHRYLQMGDAMIGALYSQGYVTVYRDEAYSDWDNNAPYIVEVTDTFSDLAEIPTILEKDLLRATSSTKIPDVHQMIQGSGRPVIKAYTEEHNVHLLASIENELPWITAFNNMQQQGWKINEEVLKIIQANKAKLIKVVPPRPHLGKASNVKEALARLKKNDSPSNRLKYNKEVDLWNGELVSLKASSKNLETEVILKKAAALLEMEEFYQYVELDYRGRAYYQESFVNYQGSDLARGLFLFSEGKPLGAEGKRWLAIHTACSYNQAYNIDEIPSWCSYDYATALKEQELESISVDKMTLTDRAEWSYQNMDKILLDSTKLVDCEKPAVYLACCLEWVQFMEDPNYLSHLPVPIDGTCNGYQHSGAIAKDEITGGLVSLVDSDLQSDLYVQAAKVLRDRKPKFFNDRPDMKMKHVRKGIAKRGVMVRAYSAGKEKISDNMYKDCYTEGYTSKYNISMLDCTGLGSDLYDLIRDVCPGATKTMSYLQDLAAFDLGSFEVFENGKQVKRSVKKNLHAAKQKLLKIKPEDMTAEQLEELRKIAARLKGIETRLVRGNGNRHLEWNTPTGFKVIYTAFLQRKVKVLSTIPGYEGGATAQPGRIRHVLQEDTTMPNISKFQSGISPNFIHSMDAAHMAYLIASWDGAFGAVHDSFSAHAADIEGLSQLTKETFVDLYDVDDPYGDIAKMILRGDAELDFDAPKYGTLDVQGVLKSKYFFC